MRKISIVQSDIRPDQTLYDLSALDIFNIVTEKLNIDDIAELIYEQDFKLTYTIDSIIFEVL